MTPESLNDIVGRIVLRHQIVDEDKLEEALDLQQEILSTDGKHASLERVLLDMGIIKGKQLKGLRYAILYYLVRKADRFYGKIAVQSDICEPDWVEKALKQQKRIHQKERRLVRVNKILIEMGYINKREDKAILKAIEGIREHKKGRKGAALSPVDAAVSSMEIEGKLASKRKKKAAPAGAEKPAPSKKKAASEDDYDSLEEIEEVSGIEEVEEIEEVEVDDVEDIEEDEKLDAVSSVEDVEGLQDVEDVPDEEDKADDAKRDAEVDAKLDIDEDDEVEELDLPEEDVEEDEDEDEEEDEEDDDDEGEAGERPLGLESAGEVEEIDEDEGEGEGEKRPAKKKAPVSDRPAKPDSRKVPEKAKDVEKKTGKLPPKKAKKEADPKAAARSDALRAKAPKPRKGSRKW